MRSQERKFSLSNDRATALELLRLQEAAQLANDQLAARRVFVRNDKLSHVVHAVLNLAQFLTALMDEIFHHVHHAINRRMRETNPDIPDMPEERNPIFFVYPICMGISLILCILWLATGHLNRRPIMALLGNAVGGILMMIGGISAMHHAEKHINLNEVSDEELLTHPIFLHNFIICIISLFGMTLYLVPTWILFDVYKWKKGQTKVVSNEKPKKKSRSEAVSHCRCQHSRRSSRGSPRHSPRSRETNADANSINRGSDVSASPVKSAKSEQDVINDPIILYCCCIDCHRYLKAARQADSFTHEFQVVQVM
ncbi:uncharacterized protein LOC100123014 isoform X1 [Nasonia vitripennis]|uniref:DUF7775 domain-containing protein n=2 Tax=Nasonia vitripennis TaxID=7425 RepID=A0A7M7H3F2_NASVI|nr:uncharacterized protein LOC100123014 isoform X1 [Nasonia vitripennis]